MRVLYGQIKDSQGNFGRSLGASWLFWWSSCLFWEGLRGHVQSSVAFLGCLGVSLGGLGGSLGGLEGRVGHLVSYLGGSGVVFGRLWAPAGPKNERLA